MKRAHDGKQPDGSAPEYRYRVPIVDIGDVGAEVARREDIRKQNSRVVIDFRRQPHQTDVGVRYPRVLRLQAMKCSGALGPAEKRRALPRGIRVIALREVASTAV